MRLTHALVWIVARDRSDQSPAPVGIWTGADSRSITIGGTPRVYHGAGALLGLSDLVAAADFKVSEWSFQVSSLHDQVIEAIRLYDSRLAPVEVHLWQWDGETHQPLGDPVREFRGTIMDVDLPMPEEGGTATATVNCVSDSWRLTRGLTLTRSHAAQQARHPGDGFRKYNDISGAVQTVWGEKSSGQPSPAQMFAARWRANESSS